MSSLLRGLYAGEVLAGGMREARHNSDIASWRRALAREEADHRRTIAVLAAAKAAIEKLDPKHLLNIQAVRTAVADLAYTVSTEHEARAVGADADLQAILTKCNEQLEAAHLEAVAIIKSTPVREKRVGWWWSRRSVFVFHSRTAHATQQIGLAVGQLTLQAARKAGLDEPLDMDTLVANAEAAHAAGANSQTASTLKTPSRFSLAVSKQQFST